MSYLEIPNAALPDFSKAVISLWFRVPQGSLDRSYAASLDDNTDMSGILPLLMFGDDTLNASRVSLEFRSLATYSIEVWDGPARGPFTVYSITDQSQLGDNVPSASPFPLSPSLIGLSLSNQDDLVTANLYISLQLADKGAMSGVHFTTESIVVDPVRVELANLFTHLTGVAYTTSSSSGSTTPVTIGGVTKGAIAGRYPFNETWNKMDVTGVYQNPENFTVVSASVTPDAWHHVLLSFDVGKSITANGSYAGGAPAMTSTCKMYLSLDDVPQDISFFALSDPDAITTNNAKNTYGTTGPSDSGPAETYEVWRQGLGQYIENHTTVGYTEPVYAYTPSPLPVSGRAIGIPATSKFNGYIYEIEMAEFQMFTGVTLDTSVEANRRVFIGKAKDGSLAPVNPLAVASPPSDPELGNARTAIKPQAPAKLLGKQADIAITGSCKYWIGGVNLGSTGQSDGGKFKPTGKIDAFLPSPKIIPKVGA